MIIIAQLLAVCLSAALAAHNAPAVSQFEHFGISDRWNARFHRYGAWTRAFFCAPIALMAGGWVEAILVGLLAAAWVYLVFDPVLNWLRRPEKRWYYLGANDSHGRFWLSAFGREAGKVKAIFLLACILVLNFIYLKLPAHVLHAAPW